MRYASISRSASALWAAALLGCGGGAGRIDVCARGDREELALALAGGQVELVLRDQGGRVLARRTSPTDAASFDVDGAAGATRVEISGIDADGLAIAGGSAALTDEGACVCLAFDAQRLAACGGIACQVQDDACLFFDEVTGEPPATRTIRLGDNDDDDVRGVTSDTYVSSEVGDTGDNFGGDVLFLAGGSAPRTGLVRFQLDALPRRSIIESAQLLLQLDRCPAALAQEPVEVYRVLEAWEEGTLTGAAGCANWMCRTLTEPWTVPGCGYLSADARSREELPLASVEAMTPGSTVQIDVTAAVEGWLAAPDLNFGIALTTATDGAYFLAREADPSLGARPRLRVSFRLP